MKPISQPLLDEPEAISDNYRQATRRDLIVGFLVLALVPVALAVLLSRVNAEEDLLTVDKVQPTAPLSNEGSYAFVTLAGDREGTETPYMHYWPVLPMARAIQRLSAYPLVLMANYSVFHDNTPFTAGMAKLGVKIVPVSPVPLTSKLPSDQPGWVIAWNKLAMFKLTNYTRLIWVDTDAILFRPVDYLFKWSADPPYAARNDWDCEPSFLNGWQYPCSCFMLLEPSIDTFNGLVSFAEQKKQIKFGDQELMQHYFAKVVGTPIQLLDPGVAQFGRCVGIHQHEKFEPAITEVKFEMPAFMHKSGDRASPYGRGVDCFNWDMDWQIVEVDGVSMNKCHHHPLGPYWRDLFCESLTIVGVTPLPGMLKFCNDTAWYR